MPSKDYSSPCPPKITPVHALQKFPSTLPSVLEGLPHCPLPLQDHLRTTTYGESISFFFLLITSSNAMSNNGLRTLPFSGRRPLGIPPIFPISTPLYLFCLHMCLRPSSPPHWDTHLPQRGHGHLFRNCVVCLFKVDVPQSYILPSLQSLFHQLNIPSTVPLPLLKPCCSIPISHSTILLILRRIMFSNTFRT